MIEWRFHVRMKGQNGEVDLHQETDKDVLNGSEIRNQLIDQALRLYRGLLK